MTVFASSSEVGRVAEEAARRRPVTDTTVIVLANKSEEEMTRSAKVVRLWADKSPRSNLINSN